MFTILADYGSLRASYVGGGFFWYIEVASTQTQCSEYARPLNTSYVTNEGVIRAILALAQAGRGVWYRNAAATQSGTNLVVTLLLLR